MKYKKELVEYELIIDRQGQGKVSRTYVLKPELPSDNVEKCMKSKRTSQKPKKGLPEVQNYRVLILILVKLILVRQSINL